MVLIKTMEMPENCNFCRFNNSGACTAMNVAYRTIIIRKKGEKYAAECPLVAVESYGPKGTLYKEI